MQKSAPLLVSALLLAACGPGVDLDLEAGAEEALPIINGEACDPGELDTAVAIILDADIDFGSFGQQRIKSPMCTGTLIAPDVVMTAAHCLDATVATFGFGEVTREEYYVTFDEDLGDLYDAQQSGQDVELPPDSVKATRWVSHENFNIQNFNQVNGPGNFFDIGLIFLERAIDTVTPEVVITAEEAAQLEEGATVQIAGWGQQTQTGQLESPPPGTVGEKMCATSFINELGSHEMQIGGDSSTSRKCHGDSGGPSYLEVTTEHARTRRVVGITSHAYDQEDCNKGGVDTRVDAWLDWFDAQMQAACADGTRVWCEVEGIIPPSFYDPPPDDGSDGKDGDGKDDDDRAPPGGCQCGESEGGDPMSVVAVLFLGALALRRRRR